MSREVGSLILTNLDLSFSFGQDLSKDAAKLKGSPVISYSGSSTGKSQGPDIFLMKKAKPC